MSSQFLSKFSTEKIISCQSGSDCRLVLRCNSCIITLQLYLRRLILRTVHLALDEINFLTLSFRFENGCEKAQIGPVLVLVFRCSCLCPRRRQKSHMFCNESEVSIGIGWVLPLG